MQVGGLSPEPEDHELTSSSASPPVSSLPRVLLPLHLTGPRLTAHPLRCCRRSRSTSLTFALPSPSLRPHADDLFCWCSDPRSRSTSRTLTPPPRSRASFPPMVSPTPSRGPISSSSPPVSPFSTGLALYLCLKVVQPVARARRWWGGAGRGLLPHEPVGRSTEGRDRVPCTEAKLTRLRSVFVSQVFPESPEWCVPGFLLSRSGRCTSERGELPSFPRRPAQSSQLTCRLLGLDCHLRPDPRRSLQGTSS